jgi:hypothetical protein
MATPVGPVSGKTTTNLDNDGIGSASDRRNLLNRTKAVVGLGETTRAGRLGFVVSNLDTLVLVGRKILTKGK